MEKVLFGAEWCAPCKALKMFAKDNSINFDTVYDIDTEEGADLSVKHSVRGVPTVIILNEGKEVSRFVGMNIDKLNELRDV